MKYRNTVFSFLLYVAFLDCRINFLDCVRYYASRFLGGIKDIVTFVRIILRKKINRMLYVVTVYTNTHTYTRIQIDYLIPESVYWLAMNIFTVLIIISSHCMALLDMR